MKRSILLLTALCTVSSLATFAQHVKDIIARHNKAIGGEEKWRTVTSIRKEGAIEMMGVSMPVTITILKGKGMRQDFTVMGNGGNYMILTPAEGWMYIPSQGHTKAQPMPAEELQGVTAQLDFQDKLMDAAVRKYTITLEGKEDIDGNACYKLKVTDKDKEAEICYVDSKTWYMVKSVKTVSAGGHTAEVVTVYSDHKKLSSGIVVPFKEDTGETGTMNFTSIETNTVKDETLFRP